MVCIRGAIPVLVHIPLCNFCPPRSTSRHSYQPSNSRAAFLFFLLYILILLAVSPLSRVARARCSSRNWPVNVRRVRRQRCRSSPPLSIVIGPRPLISCARAKERRERLHAYNRVYGRCTPRARGGNKMHRRWLRRKSGNAARGRETRV